MVWPWFAWFYLRVKADKQVQFKGALCLGTFSAITTIVVDFNRWVLIRHPLAITLKDYYVDYPTWNTLSYLIIFATPIAVAFLKDMLAGEKALST